MQLYERGIRRRLAPMFDGDRRRLELAYSLMFTLPGTPVLRYGDELGMGDDLSLPERNCCRTPFQWDDSANAGFSSARPWLPLDPDYKACNVDTLRNKAGSILDLYRQLLELRRRHAALNSGSFRLIDVQGDALIYERTAPGERILVCLNFSDGEQALAVAELSGATILASTHPDRTATISRAVLRPNEGLVFLLR
jgi:maltose alpha-D-glucosyltransferase/alpha-amylase